MHELSIAVGIIDGVLEESARRGGLSVEVVRVRIGRMSGVDKDALLFAYQVAREDTPLACSRLEIEDVQVVIFCPACAQERQTEPSVGAVCPHCGTLASRVVQGEELEITALEIAA
jgi:hydrogenase nickel incorporation protein HypA/HybF